METVGLYAEFIFQDVMAKAFYSLTTAILLGHLCLQKRPLRVYLFHVQKTFMMVTY